MPYLKMSDLDLQGKRVLIREDLNVPLKNGVITSDARIVASLPTMQKALKAGAAVMVVSHLGRPTEGEYDAKLSLAPVAAKLTTLLGQEVELIKEWINGVSVKPGQIVLCENVRFLVGEEDNDEELSEKMASLCDVYVNDAFATAHRKQASTYGIAKYAKVACAGILLEGELVALENIMDKPVRPLVAVIGGAKVSTKLKLLESIAKVVDDLIVGGGIANTFIAAAGNDVGKSLYEPNLVKDAEHLVAMAETLGVTIPMPVDVVVGAEFSETAKATVKMLDEVKEDEMILDIGPETVKIFEAVIAKAKTIVWNGPVGAFELAPFSKGTEAIATAIAKSSAYTVAGGGDTIAAIEKYNIQDQISYISTAGGAFLAYLEGDKLPAVEALETCYALTLERPRVPGLSR